MPDSKSWGHRISRLRYPGIEKCTAPGCTAHPEFRVFLQTERGPRRLNYCRLHAFNFSKNFRVRMPLLNAEDAMRVELHRFSDDGLRVLLERIQKEQENRGKTPDDLPFEYDETGTEQAPPYVARLWMKDGQLKRFFFNLPKHDLEDARINVKGTYLVRPGSIVEKRIDDEDGQGSWNRYLVLEDGSEILVAMKGDQERNALVEKYLRKEVSSACILSE